MVLVLWMKATSLEHHIPAHSWGLGSDWSIEGMEEKKPSTQTHRESRLCDGKAKAQKLGVFIELNRQVVLR